jgi:hypothetical protein
MTKEKLESLISSLSSGVGRLASETDHFIEAVLVRQKVAGLDFNEDFVKRAWEHWKKERMVDRSQGTGSRSQQ